MTAVLVNRENLIHALNEDPIRIEWGPDSLRVGRTRLPATVVDHTGGSGCVDISGTSILATLLKSESRKYVEVDQWITGALLIRTERPIIIQPSLYASKFENGQGTYCCRHFGSKSGEIVLEVTKNTIHASDSNRQWITLGRETFQLHHLERLFFPRLHSTSNLLGSSHTTVDCGDTFVIFSNPLVTLILVSLHSHTPQIARLSPSAPRKGPHPTNYTRTQ